jgi:hypothetical protein
MPVTARYHRQDADATNLSEVRLPYPPPLRFLRYLLFFCSIPTFLAIGRMSSKRQRSLLRGALNLADGSSSRTASKVAVTGKWSE